MINYLPYQFTNRDYQKPLWDAMFNKGIKRAITVWHRRAGKDKTALNITIAKMLERVGSYYYLFPELKQASRVIWKGIDADGKRFRDHFPPSLIKHIDNSEMEIQFHNGSLFKLCGSDRYDSLMGSNPCGVVLSEYSLQHPMAWDLLRPILRENGGWAIFPYTPRGQNHAFELYDRNKGNPNWHVELLTTRDTKRPDGSPVISEEMIEEERRSGMSDELIEQEFYCSFTAALPGAYFSAQLKAAEDQGRIADFPIDCRLPVKTYWDIGMDDKNAIWFIQDYPHREKRAIAYYENAGESSNHYVNYIKEFQRKYDIVYAAHYLPHDVKVREWGTGKTRYQQLKEAGLGNIKIVPRVKDKLIAIESARRIFPLMIFHKTNCRIGLACLRQYHKEYNAATRTYSDTPKHDWASNGADAFLQLAQSWQDVSHPQTTYENRVAQKSLI